MPQIGHSTGFRCLTVSRLQLQTGSGARPQVQVEKPDHGHLHADLARLHQGLFHEDFVVLVLPTAGESEKFHVVLLFRCFGVFGQAPGHEAILSQLDSDNMVSTIAVGMPASTIEVALKDKKCAMAG
jgi:hypothetical protein